MSTFETSPIAARDRRGECLVRQWLAAGVHPFFLCSLNVFELAAEWVYQGRVEAQLFFFLRVW